MSHIRVAIILIALIQVGGCANPLNQATSDRYAELCAAAERNGQLAAAEEACYRAVKNVDWGNLGAELKSQRLYNLARIKRQLGKFAEAEALLTESLRLEEALSSRDPLRIARRRIELSVNLAGQDRWAEGADDLVKVIPVAAQFQAQERAYVKLTYMEFEKRLSALGKASLAAQFAAAARAL